MRITFMKIFRNSHFPAILLVVINVIIGLQIVADFGESWDEKSMIYYANDSYEAFRTIGSDTLPAPSAPEILDFYGPGFITFTLLIEKALTNIGTGIASEDVFHFMYFLSFQLGIYSLYLINKRFMGQYAALAATLLFATQPLLFGHAFINPKDIPLLGFFLATIASGFWMFDSLKANIREEPIEEPNAMSHALKSDWEGKKPLLLKRGRLLGILLAGGVIIFLFKSPVNAVIANAIGYLLELNPESYLGSLIDSITEYSDQTTKTAYAEKGIAVFWRVFTYGLIVSAIVIMATIGWKLNHTWKAVWKYGIRPYFLEFNRSLPKKLLESLSNPRLIAAGMILGFTTAIRVIGPFAGGLVALYLITKFKSRAVAPIFGYFTIGAIITYISWPFLWDAPISRFIESLSLMSKFTWDKKVLFDGSLYRATELPNRYILDLMAIQFTEPLILLSIGGIFTALLNGYRKQLDLSIIVMMLIWFLGPVMYVVTAQPTLYDNFRQFLFITPPLFFFSGILLDKVIGRINRPIFIGIVIAAILFPGIYWGVRLHPYQYVYFNSFQGGLKGAYMQYELDYWATSYEEVMDFVNRTVERDAKIVVWGAPHLARSYARTDLSIFSSVEIQPESIGDFDYGVILNRQKLMRDLVGKGVPVFEVQRDGAVLSTVIMIPK